MKKIFKALVLALAVVCLCVACSSSPSSTKIDKVYVKVIDTKDIINEAFFITCDKGGTWYLFPETEGYGSDDGVESYHITASENGMLKGSYDKKSKSIKFEGATFDIKNKTLTYNGETLAGFTGGTQFSFFPSLYREGVDISILLCACNNKMYSLFNYTN